MLRVAINGFGRIGRNVLRAVYESGKRQQIKVVAVNELAQPDAMAHLLQYDTSHGRFGKKITNDQEHIYVHHDAPYEGAGSLTRSESSILAILNCCRGVTLRLIWYWIVRVSLGHRQMVKSI